MNSRRTIAAAAATALLPLTLAAAPAQADTGWNGLHTSAPRAARAEITPSAGAVSVKRRTHYYYEEGYGDNPPVDWKVRFTIGWKPANRGHGILFTDVWLWVINPGGGPENGVESPPFKKISLRLGANAWNLRWHRGGGRFHRDLTERRPGSKARVRLSYTMGKTGLPDGARKRFVFYVNRIQ
ncbi:MAG TPA: hypothetical protein VF642_12495 [Propionibacteriaceae bacterium]|jgi:hypothetical protein